MFYLDVLGAFHKSHIRYLIVGGLALNLHGVPRTTQDLDIIIDMYPDNIKSACATLKQTGYIPRIPEDPMGLASPDILRNWINEKNMLAFSFYNERRNSNIVDIVIAHPLKFAEADLRKSTTFVRGIEIPFVCIDDLISMKRMSERPQDISDVEMLLEVKSILDEKDE